jgi:hypothetical protein
MSLFDEIQSDLIGEATLGTILRKAKVLSYGLGNEEFKKWVENEINGYDADDELPNYRVLETLVFGDFVNARWKITGQQIPDSAIPEKWQRYFKEAWFLQPVAEIESMLSNGESLRLSVPADLFGLFNGTVVQMAQCMRAWRSVSHHQLVRLLDSTRNALLSFILELADKYPRIRTDTGFASKVPDEIIRQIFHVNIQGDAQMVVGDTISHDGDYNMTTFDQRNQQVGTQYNAGSDINFNDAQNVQEFASELQKMRDELLRISETDTVDAEIITDVDYQITKAIQAASKEHPTKSVILDHLTKVKEYVDGVDALIKIAGAVTTALAVAQTIFS